MGDDSLLNYCRVLREQMQLLKERSEVARQRSTVIRSRAHAVLERIARATKPLAERIGD